MIYMLRHQIMLNELDLTECLVFFVSQIIARVSVDNRTRALVQGLHRASDVKVYINRVEDLSYHLLEFPDTCGVAVKVTYLCKTLSY